MNKTDIKFGGSTIAVVFGSWVMGQLIKSGYKMSSLQDEMTNNPFDFFSLIVYLGAVNATQGKDTEAYDRNSFYDWIDEVGGIGSDEVGRVMEVFTRSIVGDTEAKKKKATVKA